MRKKSAYPFKIDCRISKQGYESLQKLLEQTGTESMSSLVRNILENRPIKIRNRDGSLDLLSERFLESKMVWDRGIGKLIELKVLLERSSFAARLLGFSKLNQISEELLKNIQLIEQSMNPVLEKWLQK